MPRWDWGEDHGASGRFREATVVGVEPDQFRISYPENDEPGSYTDEWSFTHDDWHKPGFPKLVPNEKQQESIDALNNWFNDT